MDKFIILNFKFLITFSTRASIPSYLPQIKIISVYFLETFFAKLVVNFSAFGIKLIIRTFLFLPFDKLRTFATAFSSGSARITIPGPPPYGLLSSGLLLLFLPFFKFLGL